MDDTGTGSRTVTLADLTKFASRSWKWMLGGAIVGGIVGALYVQKVPQSFEVTVMVRVAQIPVPVAVDAYWRAGVEAPGLLVSKLKLLNNYPAKVLAACGLPRGAEQSPGQASFSFTPQDSYNVISINVRSGVSSLIEPCALSLVELIRDLQAAESKPDTDRLRRQIETSQQRLTAIAAEIEASTKASPNALLDLALRDERNSIQTRIDAINSALDLYTDAEILTEIPSEPEKAYPRRSMQLIFIAVLGGILAGFLLASLRTIK